MKPDGTTREPVETWWITVLYDCAEARQCAARACDSLLRRFWSRIEFDLTWWAFQELEGPESSRAKQQLQQADIVVLALSHPRSVHPGLLNWLQQALTGREGREGALIALCAGTEAPLHRIDPDLNLALHRVARQTGLDYLNQAPTCLPGRLPGSVDICTHRAEENTDVIRRILNTPSGPTWGP
ncbi:MAG: hypothetical protein RMN51_10035 [Verrucomicrobiota bacterium]|nr:hypothetical protein [Limisphaera sp.]MDW8382425.1 hypothetical protein [Verrucomicrobiota bacterium]